MFIRVDTSRHKPDLTRKPPDRRAPLTRRQQPLIGGMKTPWWRPPCFRSQVLSDGHVRVSARPEVLLRGDDRVRAQLPTSGGVAAGLEDHDRMPNVLTRVVASIPRGLHLRLFVAASHCFFTPSTLRRLPRVRLTDGSSRHGQYYAATTAVAHAC